ncbi:MAG: hypothetical protein ACAI44_17170 [Candidatus Sericytochromatia bacterium]
MKTRQILFNTLAAMATTLALTSLMACSNASQLNTPAAGPSRLRATQTIPVAIQSARVSAESPTFYENRLRGFAYTWFSLFDSNAPHAEFLKRMVQDQSLEFRFPEATLRTPADFRGWYDGILKNIRVASHTVNSIQIQHQSGNEFIVHVDVLWRGIPYQGEPVVFHARQEWHVVVSGADYSDIRIRKYLVSAAE